MNNSSYSPLPAAGTWLGIDLGGSASKVVWMNAATGEVLKRQTLPQVAPEVEAMTQAMLPLLSEEVSAVVVTGGASRLLPALIDSVPVFPVLEFDAIGAAGLVIDPVLPQLVVSLGTGTAMVCNQLGDSEHVGGTGVGGGTLMGLGRLLAPVSSYSELEALAQQGNRWALDLKVSEIVGGDLGALSASMVGANFGKKADSGASSPADQLAALFAMVAETIALLAIQTARRVEARQILFVGQWMESDYVQRLLSTVASAKGVNFFFSPKGRYAVVEAAMTIARGSSL